MHVHDCMVTGVTHHTYTGMTCNDLLKILTLPYNFSYSTTETTPPTQHDLSPPPYPVSTVSPPIQTYSRPLYPSPHSFLPLSILVLAFFSVNPTSALFGVPAVTLSVVSVSKAKLGKWKTAQTLGNVALYLNICNIIYTMGMICVGVTLGDNFSISTDRLVVRSL